MFQLGKISADEFAAAGEIQRIIERYYREVGFKSGWNMDRVDCSKSAQDVLTESLGWIEMEMSYSEWRKGLCKDIAMIISMVMEVDNRSD